MGALIFLVPEGKSRVLCIVLLLFFYSDAKILLQILSTSDLDL